MPTNWLLSSEEKQNSSAVVIYTWRKTYYKRKEKKTHLSVNPVSYKLLLLWINTIVNDTERKSLFSLINAMNRLIAKISTKFH